MVARWREEGRRGASRQRHRRHRAAWGGVCDTPLGVMGSVAELGHVMLVSLMTLLFRPGP